MTLCDIFFKIKHFNVYILHLEDDCHSHYYYTQHSCMWHPILIYKKKKILLGAAGSVILIGINNCITFNFIFKLVVNYFPMTGLSNKYI